MAAKASPALTLTLDQARAAWHARQGLLDPADLDPATLLERTGWARTLGGVDVYFALRARSRGLRRAMVDGAVASGAVRVVPAVRGCIYLVPAAHVDLVMALAADLARPRITRELDKAGSSWEEVEDLVEAVREVLANGPLTTDAVRRALPEGAVRSLGEAGKKVGLSSPLPIALRELEFRGMIARKPIEDRLDTERYVWSSIGGSRPADVPGDPTQRLRAVVDLILGWHGPLTVKELSTWIGVPQRDIKAALEEFDVLSVAIEGRPGVAVARAADREILAPSRVREVPTCSLLPFEDTLLTIHGGPAPFVDPAFHELSLPTWGGRAKIEKLGELNHLGRRPILVGERLVGFWEWDAKGGDGGGEIVNWIFDALSRDRQAALDAARAELARWIPAELGHARSFSLDTDDAVAARVAELRERGEA